MSSRKRPVIARTLARVIAGRPDGQHRHQVFATFTDVTGPGLGAGREAQVVFSFSELASLLGSIPALYIGPENIRAYAQVTDMLQALENEPPP